MGVWYWRAADEKGTIQRGMIEQESAETVRRYLQNQGWFPLTVRWDLVRNISRGFGKRSTDRYWSRTIHQLAVMLEAGVPLPIAIRFTAAEEKQILRQKQWENIYQALCRGDAVRSAFRFLAPPPPAFVLAMVEAGEQSGTLSDVFLEVAAEIEEGRQFNQKIRAALFYPALLLAMALLIVTALGIFVLPLYESFFADLDAQLPLPTRILFQFGTIIPWLLALSGGVLGGMGIRKVVRLWVARHKKTVPGERLPRGTGSWIGNFPLWREVRRCAELAQVFGMMARLMKAGMALGETLSFIEQSTPHQEVAAVMQNLAAGIRRGTPFGTLAQALAYFPRETVEMLIVAEEAGEVEAMFTYLSRLYREELEKRLAELTRVVEPALIALMAGLVGMVALGVMLPIFEASSYLGN